MDAVDKRIVELLQEDGRITMKQLGKVVGLTAPAAAERVRKLEEQGVITGYKATVNPEKMNKHVTAFVLFDTTQCKKFVEFCKTYPDVTECYRLAGQYSYLVKVVTQSVHSLERFIDQAMPYGKSSTLIVLSSAVTDKAVALELDD
ncbi:Lrp/AsnC family transcriptional regulator [Brevibacillus sp. SYP-B805]|uniref:AsnC family transcriptional regulator n=1 Tax=Brevibacillus sp. SYP-B805 TaxID=1578199 RepID=UPI0013EA776D|nr:Lrp/AsnC family transcriptional regulator [Brevibacillus sp. SYP-B805]